MQQSLLNRMKTGKRGFGIKKSVPKINTKINAKPMEVKNTDNDVVEHDSDEG